MNMMKIKTYRRTIIGFIIITLIIIVNGYVILRGPSKGDRQKEVNKFVSLMTDTQAIERIEIYYNWEKKIVITDKKVINQICIASKEYYGEKRVFDGGYSDWYLIRFILKNENYSIRYYKKMRHPDIRRRELVKDGTTYSNYWDDCGQLIILKNPNCPEENIEKGCSGAVAYLNNIDLIPLLREYVDPYVKKAIKE